MLSLEASVWRVGGLGLPMYTQMGKGGFEFRVVLPYWVRIAVCHFSIMSRYSNGFVVVLKRGKKEPLS